MFVLSLSWFVRWLRRLSANNTLGTIIDMLFYLSPIEHPGKRAASEALRIHHKELMKLPLQDLLPELYSDGLITEETQERIAHPRAVYIKREANQLILQDVRQAIGNQPGHLDRFLKSLQTLQPAVGLSQRIKGMYANMHGCVNVAVYNAIPDMYIQCTCTIMPVHMYTLRYLWKYYDIV